MEGEVKKTKFRGFYGNYQHTLDVKGRVFVPSRFRDGLEDGFMLTKGLDGCLAAYPMDEWDALAEQMDGSSSFTQKDNREFIRFLYANATECEMDKQGRIGIPVDLREFAGLTKEVYFTGARKHFEVWDYESWMVNSKKYDTNADELAGRLHQKNNQ